MNSLASLKASPPGDDDLLDVLVIEVADRALDQVAFLVDEARRLALQRQVADALPQAQQVLEVALDLLLGACRARRADDEPHALRHLELGRDRLQALAVLRVGDLARDAAAARGVGHQHRVAAGERQVGGERGALVAALLLDDLHQDDLAALDDLLDLVAARTPARPGGELFQSILARADLLDALGFASRAVALDFLNAALAARFGSRGGLLACGRIGIGAGIERVLVRGGILVGGFRRDEVVVLG